MIQLVEKEIQNYEAKTMSWIISGFPRTRVQALALQTMEIYPDRMINLTTQKEDSLAHFKEGLAQRNEEHKGEDLDEIAERMYQEWEINSNAVLQTFNQYVYEKDVSGMEPMYVTNDLKRMLSIRFRNNAPRRPPKILLIGPPGSGRST